MNTIQKIAELNNQLATANTENLRLNAELDKIKGIDPKAMDEKIAGLEKSLKDEQAAHATEKNTHLLAKQEIEKLKGEKKALEDSNKSTDTKAAEKAAEIAASQGGKPVAPDANDGNPAASWDEYAKIKGTAEKRAYWEKNKAVLDAK
ncbi:MAG: hypothetical protein JWM68_2517 [Verrucomicrobiales bacterium]|nr:hypothetical protein [Verrucomicrobiales bacterium]